MPHILFDSHLHTTDVILNYLSSKVDFIREFLNVLYISFGVFISRKTRAEPLLQTEELNQQQAMQKAEEVHQFRQYWTRVLGVRGTDQEEWFKLKDEVLEMYGEMQVSLKLDTWITVDKFFCNIKMIS